MYWNRLFSWTLIFSVLLFTVSAITVSVDDFDFCDNFPQYTLSDTDEINILSKSNKSSSTLDKIFTPKYVLYCDIRIVPKSSAKKQYIKVAFDRLKIEDCSKNTLEIYQLEPSNRGVYKELTSVQCTETVLDPVVTSKPKSGVVVKFINGPEDSSDVIDFKIRVFLIENPNAEEGLSFAVKLVIGLSCAIVIIFIIILTVKTIRYKRKLKKYDEEERAESLAMHSPAQNNADPDQNVEPTTIQPPSYDEIYKYK